VVLAEGGELLAIPGGFFANGGGLPDVAGEVLAIPGGEPGVGFAVGNASPK